MPQRLTFALLILLFVLLDCGSGLASAAALSVSPGFQHQSLAGALIWLEDRDGTLRADDLLTDHSDQPWQHAAEANLNFGFTQSVYWARFDITSPALLPQNLYLEISYPLLDDIQIYLARDNSILQRYELGANRPFAQRLIQHSNFLVPVDVTQQPLTVLLRVETQSSMQIPLQLWEKDAFVERTYFEATAYGVFYGAVLIIALYHLLLFFSVREIGFLYFCGFAVCSVMAEAALRGTGFAFVWPDATTWVDQSIIVSIAGSAVASCLFTNNVLLVRQTHPLISRWLQAVVMLALAALVGTFVLPYKIMIALGLLLAMLASLVNLTANVRRVLDGYTPARYVLLGGILFIASLLVLIFSKLGWLPRNAFTENSLYIGTVLQTLLFALSLAERMNLDRRLREEAQLKSAATQQELLDVQLKINEDLDRRVRERTNELQAANEKLQELSTTDGLTGLRNRRYLDDMLAAEYKRAYRDKLPLSVLLFDIDHFKKINDTYGHPFGDLCLVQAAALIRKNICRPPDVAARYGGEEFLVLLPATDQHGACSVANNILAAFNQHRVVDGDTSVTVTVSIGVASQIPDGHGSQEQLLKQADELLYRAKQNGRNRIEVQAED